MNPNTILLIVAIAAAVLVVALIAWILRRASKRRHNSRGPSVPSAGGCGCNQCPPTPQHSCESAYRCADGSVPVIVDGATCDRSDTTRIHQSVLQVIADEYHAKARQRQTDEAFETLAELASDRKSDSESN